jgi:hypothetical protein
LTLQEYPPAQSFTLSQVDWQAEDFPSQTNGKQLGLPPAPAATMTQVPFVAAPAAVEHASQAPAQAELQHTPSAQKPDAHCSFALHACPIARAPLHAP